MILVTRGIIIENGYVLAAQRPAEMSLPFKWELPGGKLEPGEDPQTCLFRETVEELGLETRIVDSLEPVDREYKGKQYRMLPFICELTGGELGIFEHEQAAWIPIEMLFTLDWAPAELKVLKSWIENHSPEMAADVPPSREIEYIKTKVVA